MNNSRNATTHAMPICPACGNGTLQPATETRLFTPNGKRVEVELLTSICDACGADAIRPAQHRENLERLKARKVHYGKLLMGEEILALRKRYGLTQQQASAVFGKGKIAFSRYESETTYPDESTTLLLTLAMERPEVMKSLADKAGVELPLWAERCEDGQRVKLRAIRGVPAPATHREQMRFTVLMSESIPGHRHGSIDIKKVSSIWTEAACNDPQALEAVAS